jgi:chromosome partitioning protein
VITLTACALKGGVSKTTLCHHLGGTLAKMGRRVLLVDCDPQASLTAGIISPTAAESLDPRRTMAALYSGDAPFPDQIILKTTVPGLDLIPGSKAAATFNLPDPHLQPVDRQTCLRAFLEEVADDYDVAIADNPPNLALATWASLVAADFAIIPTACEDYGTMSISPVFESLELVTRLMNPRLRNLGLLLSLVQPRLAIHALYERMLRDTYGPLVFATRVPSAVDIKEAVMQRLPISTYKPKGASAKVFAALAAEVFERIEAKPLAGERGAA